MTVSTKNNSLYTPSVKINFENYKSKDEEYQVLHSKTFCYQTPITGYGVQC